MAKMFGGKNRIAMLLFAALSSLIIAGPALAEGSGTNDFLEKFKQKRLERAKSEASRKKIAKPRSSKSAIVKPVDPVVLALPDEEPIVAKKIFAPPKRKTFFPTPSKPAVEVALPKGKSITKTEIVADQSVKPAVSTQSAAWLNNAVARYQQIAAAGGWPKVSGKLRAGSKGQDVETLKRRLYAEGYINEAAVSGENVGIFTTGTEKALSQFQANNGLPQTGFTDKPTLAALNVSVNQRLAVMRANTSRIDAYTKDLGARYIVVNIPALQLEAVQNGTVYSRHNVIVGKPERPSPVVMTTLKEINFNPYWNVPKSIVERDIIPRILKEGVKSLDVQNIKVFDGFGGPEITDFESIDWANTPGDRYHLRQEPGKENAMAAAKITFPSPFGVYMHDTPLKSLFGGASRYLSSGCVRIEKVQIVVDWILNGQDGWNADRIEQIAASQERLDVTLVDPPQLRWVYLTAWADENGFMHFRDDIYDLDGSGFTVGQPLPVGEYAEDGQRFMLKLPPEQSLAAASDFDAVEGYKPRKAKPAPEAKVVKKASVKTLAKASVPTTAPSSKAAAVSNGKPQKKTKLAEADVKLPKKKKATPEADVQKRKKLLQKILEQGSSD